jgi:hypothetical protein
MRLGIGTIATVLLLLGTAGSGLAVVNCKQVNKYLDTGRTVKDVAETMVIDEAEVRKCQEQKAEEKPAEGKAAEAPAGEKK